MENIRFAQQEKEPSTASFNDRESMALLHQCADSLKEALHAFSQLLPMMTDESLQKMTRFYRALYETGAENCRHLLAENGIEFKKSVSESSTPWLSAQVKLAFRSDTSTLAALLFDGCHKMIRELYIALHQSQNASPEIRRTVYRLIGSTEDFRDELKAFL